jgi:hypothetical protein
MTLSNSIIYIYKYELLADNSVNTVSFHTTYVMSSGPYIGHNTRARKRKRQECADIELLKIPITNIDELSLLPCDVSLLPKHKKADISTHPEFEMDISTLPEFEMDTSTLPDEKDDCDAILNTPTQYNPLSSMLDLDLAEFLHDLRQSLDTPPTTP